MVISSHPCPWHWCYFYVLQWAGFTRSVKGRGSTGEGRNTVWILLYSCLMPCKLLIYLEAIDHSNEEGSWSTSQCTLLDLSYIKPQQLELLYIKLQKWSWQSCLCCGKDGCAVRRCQHTWCLISCKSCLELFTTEHSITAILHKPRTAGAEDDAQVISELENVLGLNIKCKQGGTRYSVQE